MMVKNYQFSSQGVSHHTGQAAHTGQDEQRGLGWLMRQQEDEKYCLS